MKTHRAAEMGKRPARVANCSGYHGKITHFASCFAHFLRIALGDPAEEMYHQATLGDVDFITGDYLAGIQPRSLSLLPR